MTFDELYFSVKKKIQENSGIVLDNKLFAVTLGDIYGNAFYVLWKDGKFSVEPYKKPKPTLSAAIAELANNIVINIKITKILPILILLTSIA